MTKACAENIGKHGAKEGRREAAMSSHLPSEFSVAAGVYRRAKATRDLVQQHWSTAEAEVKPYRIWAEQVKTEEARAAYAEAKRRTDYDAIERAYEEAADRMYEALDEVARVPPADLGEFILKGELLALNLPDARLSYADVLDMAVRDLGPLIGNRLSLSDQSARLARQWRMLPDDPEFNADRSHACWQIAGGRMRAVV